MRFDLISIFPDFFASIFEYGILRRARSAGLVEIATHDLRSFTHDRHRTVDDRPFGGGEGMILKLEPLYDAVSSLNITHKRERDPLRESVILLSAQGRPFTQKIAYDLSGLERVVLICGRYEGVDERVNELLCDRELSIGDYVLSGGEPAALTLLDAIIRILPGVMGNDLSGLHESFEGGLLEHPHYTRPQIWEDREIPAVLTSGNHAAITKWQREQAEDLTRQRRPDLLEEKAKK